MKENNHKCSRHCETHSYSMENMETEEENSGVWEATKESVAKAWSATKEGASKAWEKTKDVTEDITGFGNNKEDDEDAYFENESIIGDKGYSLHHSHGFSEDNGEFASFSETDGNIVHPAPHSSKNSSSQHARR